MIKGLVSSIVVAGVATVLFSASQAKADAAADGLAFANAQVAKHRAVPEFVAPGPAFDIKACAAGKKMLSIPNSSANQFLKGIITSMVKTGKEIGLEVVEWENQGQPSQWVQGMDYAVQNNFDIVDLISGISPASLEPSIKLANAAGVKTMTSHFYDPSQTPNPLVSSSLPVSFNKIGKLLAYWAIHRTDGKAKILVVQTDEVPPTGPLVKGIKDEIAAHCPNCEIIQHINVGITEWGTKIQPSVQSALLAHPEVNFVLPIYDSMVQFVVPALAITGKTDTVKIASFNGTPFVLDFIAQNKVDMDIGESLDWIGKATIDAHLRDLCGLEVPSEISVPFYLIDSSNVADAGSPAQFDKGYGDKYVTGFRKLWMLDK